MKINVLNSYVFDRLDSMEKNLSDYTKDKAPERLHRLRVEIKKIKAAYSFAKFIYNEKYSTDALKPLFNKAGKIREIQINIQLLSMFPQPPMRLISQLKSKEHTLSQQFVKNSLRYFKILGDFRKSVHFPEKLADNKAIRRYFNQAKDKTRQIIRGKDRVSIHRYRMRIKKIMYVYKLLPKRLRKNVELNEPLIKKQQQALGEWHDTYSVIHFLSMQLVPKKTMNYFLQMKEKEINQFHALLATLASEPI